MGSSCGQIRRSKSAFKILTRKPTGKGSLGRSRGRCEDIFRIVLEEIGINTRNKVDSVQDRDYCSSVMKAVLNLRVA